MSDVNSGTRYDMGQPLPELPRSHDGPLDAFGAPAADPLTFPRIPAHLVPRLRHHRRLDRMAAVTIVEGLPGCGKTTLVAVWARQHANRGSRVVWVGASDELDDVSTFAHWLHRGLVRDGAVREASPASPTSGDPQPAWVAELARSPQPVIVVVDDAHLLRDPSVADRLMCLVRFAHPVHVVVCCDTDHHFHDAAERHRLESNVLCGDDLRISADVVPAFADAWGHALDDESAKVLHDLVGGWLLPLRLVLDATPRSADAFATHVAHEYLMSRVLPAITDSAELSIAMRFAVPDRLDIDLATELLPADDDMSRPRASGELATATLERRGLLWRVPRHDGLAQWRYPKLVRAVLLEQLEQLERSQPDAASSAHRITAHALLDAPGDRAGELLRHARAAGDWPLLARLWAERGWSLAGADADAFEFAYAEIPGPALVENEALLLAASLGDALATTSVEANWMNRVEVMLRHYMDAGIDYLRSPRQVRDPTARVELLTAAMIARRSKGRLEEAGELAAEATRELSRARVLEPAHMPSSQAWLSLQSAITQGLDGNFGGTLDLATAAYQTGPKTLIGAGAAALLSMMHAISGQPTEVRHWLAEHEAVDIGDYWAAGLAELPARLARAMLALDRLDATTAESELSGITLGSDASGMWPFILMVQVRHALLFGDPVAMLTRLDHLGRIMTNQLQQSDGFGRHSFDRCSISLLLAMGEVNRVQSRIGEGHDAPSWLCTPAARFHLMTGNARKAMRIASAAAWRNDVHTRDRLELLVINTLACRAQGKKDPALESFRRAHALVLDTGNLQAFLALPSDVRQELLHATGLELDDDVVNRLDAARRVYPDHAILIELSPRELEVLRQIPRHETSAALARKLSVSVNTINKQLGSLYAKLGVNERSSAILRARRLGLIDDDEDGGSEEA